MNKKHFMLPLVTAAAMSFSVSAFQEMQEPTAADIKPIIEACKGYAAEDGVAADQLNDYLLTCVNDDLETLDMKKISLEKLLELLKDE